jgi:hypothetical protein
MLLLLLHASLVSNHDAMTDGNDAENETEYPHRLCESNLTPPAVCSSHPPSSTFNQSETTHINASSTCWPVVFFQVSLIQQERKRQKKNLFFTFLIILFFLPLSQWKATTDPGKQLAGAHGGHYGRNSQAAGPQSSTTAYVATQDSGKQAPAGTSGGSYGRHSNAAGPQSSSAEYVATQDSGKQAPAGTGGLYGRHSNAAGPHSSSAEYVATQDSGKQAPAGTTAGRYGRQAEAAGPHSSSAEYVATQDSGKQAPAGTGGLYGRQSEASGPLSNKDYVAAQDPGVHVGVSGSASQQ